MAFIQPFFPTFLPLDFMPCKSSLMTIMARLWFPKTKIPFKSVICLNKTEIIFSKNLLIRSKRAKAFLLLFNFLMNIENCTLLIYVYIWYVNIYLVFGYTCVLLSFVFWQRFIYFVYFHFFATIWFLFTFDFWSP